MAKINLGKMDLNELKTLQQDVTKAIDQYEKIRRKEALQAAEKAAGEMGYTLAGLLGPKKTAKSATPPKYRHPEDPELTWTGRGRKPHWYIAALEDGKKPEDLEIS